MSKSAIFISSSTEGYPIARELALQLEPSATPYLWPERVFQPGKIITESLTEVVDRVDFAAFVLTPDIVDSGKTEARYPHANVFFELGLLIGQLGLSRTFIVVVDSEHTLIPSDLTGVMFISLSIRDESELPTCMAAVTAVITNTITNIGRRTERRSELLSCYISYSWRDKDFAARLHRDLQATGVHSWLDAQEIRAGDNILEQLKKAIRAHDKVLLILSQASIKSPWINKEIQKALEIERARQSTVLFPCRLDNSIFATKSTTELDRIKDRLILDFSEWHDQSQYQRAFSRLVRDFMISASIESERGK